MTAEKDLALAVVSVPKVKTGDIVFDTLSHQRAIHIEAIACQTRFLQTSQARTADLLSLIEELRVGLAQIDEALARLGAPTVVNLPKKKR